MKNGRVPRIGFSFVLLLALTSVPQLVARQSASFPPNAVAQASSLTDQLNQEEKQVLSVLGSVGVTNATYGNITATGTDTITWFQNPPDYRAAGTGHSIYVNINGLPPSGNISSQQGGLVGPYFDVGIANSGPSPSGNYSIMTSDALPSTDELNYWATGSADAHFQCGSIDVEVKSFGQTDYSKTPTNATSQDLAGYFSQMKSAANSLESAARSDAASKATTIAKGLAADGLCSAGQQPPSHLPIIFIPGVGGSYIYENGTLSLNGGKTNLWPRTGPSASSLFLKEDGITPKTPLKPGQSIFSDSILASHGLGSSHDPFNFYGGLEDYLTSNKNYTLGKDLVEFPYDWRLDNKLHLDELDKVVNGLISSTGQQKVMIIAHSMGGIIGKAYADSIGADKVDTLITIGTPFFGAVKPFYALVKGYNFDNPLATSLAFKIMAQNAPAVYELNPKVPFIFDNANGKYVQLNDTFGISYKPVRLGVFTYSEGSNNVWSPNLNLVNMSDSFYKLIGTKAAPLPMPNGIKHYALIGTGLKTLDGYNMTDVNSSDSRQYLELLGRHVGFTAHFGDGDGTVPMFSSDISGTTASYYIPYKANDTSSHGALTDNKSVQKIVGSILDGNPASPSDYAYKLQNLTDTAPNANFSMP